MIRRLLATLLTTLILSVSCLGQESEGDTRWWQRERLTPSATQSVNPKYVAKKRELEILWDRRTEAIEAMEYFGKKGQKSTAIQGAIGSIERELGELEGELKEIRPYVEKDAASSGGALRVPSTTSNIDSSAAAETTTFGDRVMFRLNLVGWSTKGLIEFSNVFDTTGGARFFGVRVIPGRHALSCFQSIDNVAESAKELGVSPAHITILFKELYSPDMWPNDRDDRIPEIRKIEAALAEGQGVFVPLIHDGDEVSIALPKGVYFLQYVAVMHRPWRHGGFTHFGRSKNITDRPHLPAFGPYYVVVDGQQQPVITCKPTPYAIERDEDRAYYTRLMELGAEALIETTIARVAETTRSPAKASEVSPAVEVKVRCLSCDHLSPETANFCSNCGKALRATPTTQDKEAPPPRKE